MCAVIFVVLLYLSTYKTYSMTKTYVIGNVNDTKVKLIKTKLIIKSTI